jgi:hypothetical protein
MDEAGIISSAVISRSINLKKTLVSIVTHTRKRRKNNMLTPGDIERYKGHIASKERAREEKEYDKERGLF